MRSVPLFRWLLGSDLDRLPHQVRRFHDSCEDRRWVGVAQVERGKGVLARAAGELLGAPPPGRDIPLVVTVSPSRGDEHWVRAFGDHCLPSVLRPYQRGDRAMFREQFGSVRIAIEPVIDGDRLHFVTRHWWLFSVPMPRWLMPVAATYETQQDDRFYFDVTMKAPIIGLVAIYRGWLAKTD